MGDKGGDLGRGTGVRDARNFQFFLECRKSCPLLVSCTSPCPMGDV